ncbi:MAG TPA: hypothetical protein VFL86_11845 [Burkholderiaceae bacterium]|nr:hypothetical protein [Burkholderiaceae bacterium]
MSQSSTVQASNVGHFLHDSRISAPLADLLQGAHAGYAAVERAASAAGWHGVSDIQTLEGLGGDHLWPENLFQVARIGFRFDPDRVGSRGTYEITSWFGTFEQGVFYCVPNNPAIGWAAIALAPGNSASPRSFVVAGMFTDSNWKIEILLLNKLNDQGLVQPPFSAVRIP